MTFGVPAEQQMFVFSEFPGQSLQDHWAVTSRQSGDGIRSFPGEAALASVVAFGDSFHSTDQAGKFVHVLQPSETQAAASSREGCMFFGAAGLLQQVFPMTRRQT